MKAKDKDKSSISFLQFCLFMAKKLCFPKVLSPLTDGEMMGRKRENLKLQGDKDREREREAI